MEEIFVWVKNVIGSLCILELLYHVVQNTEYQKYLRFFGGLVFLLIALEPVMGLLGAEEVFERAFEKAALKAEVNLGKENAQAFQEMQNQQVTKAYLAELERQIESVVTLCGQIPADEEITLDPETFSEIRQLKISFFLQEGEKTEQMAAQQIQMEICSVYGLNAEQIVVTAKE